MQAVKLKRVVIALVTVTALLGPVGVSFASADASPPIELSIDATTATRDAVDLHVEGTDVTAIDQASVGKTLDVSTSVGPLAYQTNADATQQNAVAVVTSDSEATIAWDFTEQSSPVSVEVNGQSVPNEDPSGSISVDLPADQSVTQVTVTQQTAPVGDSAAADQLVYENVVSLNVMQPMMMSLAAPVATSTVLRYQTFIPNEHVLAPPGCAATIFLADYPWATPWYSGNYRDFEMPSTNNKTASQLNLDWVNHSWTLNKATGDTDVWVYYLLGMHLDHKYTLNAGTENIHANVSFSSSSAYVHMWEDVSNPDCPDFIGGIHYDIAGHVYHAGGYSLSGEYRKVPNHEFAYRDSTNHTWDTIYHYAIPSVASFACFTPVIDDSQTCIDTGSWQR